MLLTRFQGHRPFGSREEDFFSGFYHIWAWRSPWWCDQDHLNKLSFPHPMETPFQHYFFYCKHLYTCNTKETNNFLPGTCMCNFGANQPFAGVTITFNRRFDRSAGFRVGQGEYMCMCIASLHHWSSINYMCVCLKCHFTLVFLNGVHYA